jgi:hypothetical protein
VLGYSHMNVCLKDNHRAVGRLQDVWDKDASVHELTLERSILTSGTMAP